MAEWQSGYAAACKAVYAGSIPTSASNFNSFTAGWQSVDATGCASPVQAGSNPRPRLQMVTARVVK